MSLPKQVVDDVLYLWTQIKQFQRLMRYWHEQDERYVMEILSPMTDVATREILVRVRDMYKREILDIVEKAMKESEKKE